MQWNHACDTHTQSYVTSTKFIQSQLAALIVGERVETTRAMMHLDEEVGTQAVKLRRVMSDDEPLELVRLLVHHLLRMAQVNPL